MAHEQEEHDSLIKTPKQLIITVVLAFVVPIAIAVLLSQLVTSGRRAEVPAERTATLIAPVARVELGAAAGGPKVAKTGEQVYQAACAACHASGAAGAPKLGDKAAWAARLGQGLEGLTKVVIAGKGAMPARAGNPDLSDLEIARGVVHMANQSGANFKEPAEPAATPAAPAAAPSAPAAPAAAAPAAVAPAATQAAPAAADGKAVYEKACVACHASGVAGAPKFGDKAAWSTRLGQGLDALTKTAIAGKGAMPPKGGNTALSDAEIKAAVSHMVAAAK